MSCCTDDRGVSQRPISLPTLCLMMVSDTFENAFRTRSAVGLSVPWLRFSGCNPGSLA